MLTQRDIPPLEAGQCRWAGSSIRESLLQPTKCSQVRRDLCSRILEIWHRVSGVGDALCDLLRGDGLRPLVRLWNRRRKVVVSEELMNIGVRKGRQGIGT
jgi:hypothetical protein